MVDFSFVNTSTDMAEKSAAVSTGLSLSEKLEILSDAAKYDVACTSSGSDRRGQKGMLGNSVAAGVCHAFAADGRCISLLKILMSNHCVYDCKYCSNRRSNDVRRATFTPEEICTLTIEFYKRNYIEGLFLSSGIIETPDKTMELMCRTLRLLRTTYRFNGYIHVKAIPGASEELLYSAGLLADRISINMELPNQSSLSLLAPNKTMKNILRPMGQITDTIAGHRLAIGKSARMERAVINNHLADSIWGSPGAGRLEGSRFEGIGSSASPFTDASSSAITRSELDSIVSPGRLMYPAERKDRDLRRPFAPAGQSTQMIIGATGETDYDIIRTSQSLYQGFDLKRVFYSGYIPINEDAALPELGTPVPLLREHRLYQADWLLRYYGFHAEEILSPDKPNLDSRIDPKCDWALRHLDIFPVEVNTASYDTLLRVPGIGPTGVKKIMSARRYGHVNFDMLKKMHIALKRAQFFITCGGKMLYNIPIEEQFILHRLADDEKPELMRIEGKDVNYEQMNLFRDFHLQGGTGT